MLRGREWIDQTRGIHSYNSQTSQQLQLHEGLDLCLPIFNHLAQLRHAKYTHLHSFSMQPHSLSIQSQYTCIRYTCTAVQSNKESVNWIMLYCTVRHIVPYCTVPYCTVPYCTVLTIVTVQYTRTHTVPLYMYSTDAERVRCTCIGQLYRTYVPQW